MRPSLDPGDHLGRHRRPAQDSRMRIVLADYSGHAFTAQLARALARRGHRVLHLHFAEFQTPKGRLARCPDDPPDLAFRAISIGGPFAKHRLLRRRFQEAEVGRRFAARVREFVPDAVIAANLPLDALRLMQQGARHARARFVFWQQDIYSEAIARILRRKLGWLGGAVGLWYRALEKRLLAKSDAIVVIAEDFARHVQGEMGVTHVPIHVIENWAPLDEIPERPKDNPWARAHGLHAKAVVLYTGTLGMKHDPSLLLSLAHGLRGRPDCVLAVCSEGPAVDWLRARKDELNLSSLLLLGFQPFHAYPDVLGAGDVMLAILENEAGVFSVPSKVLSYLCAGRPIVFCGPETNLAARLIERAGAGVVLAEGQRRDLLPCILRLMGDRDARADMGAKGRVYAEAAFDINQIAARFETVLNSKNRQAGVA